MAIIRRLSVGVKNLELRIRKPNIYLFVDDTSPHQNGSAVLANERRRIFKQIIVNCVLQLLLIETTHEILQSHEVYSTMPPGCLFDLIGQLDHSYQFARSFNEDKDLRTGLWKVGA